MRLSVENEVSKETQLVVDGLKLKKKTGRTKEGKGSVRN